MMPKLKHSFSSTESSDTRKTSPTEIQSLNLIALGPMYHLSLVTDVGLTVSRKHTLCIPDLHLLSLGSVSSLSSLLSELRVSICSSYQPTSIVIISIMVGGFRTWYLHHARTLQHPLGGRR